MFKYLTAGAVFAFIVSAGLAPVARAADTPEANAKVVHEFLDSWSGHDVDKIASYLGDDVVYENVPPLGPKAVMHGKAEARAFLEPFFKPDALIVSSGFHTVVDRTIADDQGGVVIERTDHQMVADKDYPLRVAAVFTVKGGKIVKWTDYFDSKGFDPVAALMTGLAKK